MDSNFTIILTVLGVLILLGFLSFALLSIKEREIRATRMSILIGVLGSLPFFIATAFSMPVGIAVLGLAGLGVAGAVIAALLPIGRVEPLGDIPVQRFDERDIVFARAYLKPGSADYESYYATRPEKKAIDDANRNRPGILSTRARKADPWLFSVAKASFSFTEAVRDEVDGPIAPEVVSTDPAEMAKFIKDVARFYGARSVGITELQPYHVYSHIGRGSGKYGDPIELSHKYAIAFTVEQSHAIMGTAPEAPVVMETALRYADAALIALQLGYMIRRFGYPAKAHIAGNYQVIAPLIARDAGLGEIGRIGLMLTSELGPRVRLAVVTTDLPLVADERMDGNAIIDFCRICKKCADNCPSRSISFDDRQEYDGAFRWRINADTCYQYWRVIGTDCGRCVSVCPYSHPDNLGHNMARWAVRRSGAARRALLWLDDVFYGQKPACKPYPVSVPRLGPISEH